MDAGQQAVADDQARRIAQRLKDGAGRGESTQRLVQTPLLQVDIAQVAQRPRLAVAVAQSPENVQCLLTIPDRFLPAALLQVIFSPLSPPPQRGRRGLGANIRQQVIPGIVGHYTSLRLVLQLL